jgi:hypothetical protein
MFSKLRKQSEFTSGGLFAAGSEVFFSPKKKTFMKFEQILKIMLSEHVFFYFSKQRSGNTFSSSMAPK